VRKKAAAWRGRLARGAALAVVGLALTLPTLAGASGATKGSASGKGIFQTTREYVVRFYPRWFTYSQSKLAPATGLSMPRRITPLYRTVVAINHDTFYAAGFANLATEPAVLTIPKTRVSYSLLTLDGFGEIFKTAIEKHKPGTYALVGPEWTRTLPAGVTPIAVPYNTTQWYIRADRYSPNGLGPAAARNFVRQLRLTTLSEWEQNPLAGATKVVSELLYGVPYKGIADRGAELTPIDPLGVPMARSGRRPPEDRPRSPRCLGGRSQRLHRQPLPADNRRPRRLHSHRPGSTWNRLARGARRSPSGSQTSGGMGALGRRRRD